LYLSSLVASSKPALTAATLSEYPEHGLGHALVSSLVAGLSLHKTPQQIQSLLSIHLKRALPTLPCHLI
jgi:pyrroline-5-carboxylate reductase